MRASLIIMSLLLCISTGFAEPARLVAQSDKILQSIPGSENQTIVSNHLANPPHPNKPCKKTHHKKKHTRKKSAHTKK